MNIPILGTRIDERFLEHRRRATSLAGIIGAVTALGLWYYRFYVHHIWDWALFAVPVTFVVVKLSLLAWYRLTD